MQAMPKLTSRRGSDLRRDSTLLWIDSTCPCLFNWLCSAAAIDLSPYSIRVELINGHLYRPDYCALCAARLTKTSKDTPGLGH
jgi:hypothetical protein